MATETVKDVAGIGVAPEVRQTLEELQKAYFLTIGGAFKACVALAIAKNLSLVEPTKVERTWQTGGAFSDVMDLVAWKFDSDRPAKMVEALGHTGLVHVREQVRAGASFTTIFGF